MSRKWIVFPLFAFFFNLLNAQPNTQPAASDTVQKDTAQKSIARIDTIQKEVLPQEDYFEKQYQINILKTHLNGIYIPKDIFDGFEQIKRLMDPSTIREFQALPEERAAKKIYLVMWIAQNWHFREGSRLSHLIRELGITYPEHMAHFIVITFHRHLNGKDLGIKERVEFYKQKEKEAFDKAKENQKKEILFEQKRKRKE